MSAYQNYDANLIINAHQAFTTPSDKKAQWKRIDTHFAPKPTFDTFTLFGVGNVTHKFRYALK